MAVSDGVDPACRRAPNIHPLAHRAYGRRPVPSFCYDVARSFRLRSAAPDASGASTVHRRTTLWKVARFTFGPLNVGVAGVLVPRPTRAPRSSR